MRKERTQGILMSKQIVLASAGQSETAQVIPHLEQRDWQVVMATTATETLSLIEQVRPLAAIIDVDLPDMTGWDVLQQVRQSPLLRSTAVILVYPAGASDEDYFRGMQLGADVNLSSPFEPLEMISFLSRLACYE